MKIQSQDGKLFPGKENPPQKAGKSTKNVKITLWAENLHQGYKPHSKCDKFIIEVDNFLLRFTPGGKNSLQEWKIHTKIGKFTPRMKNSLQEWKINSKSGKFTHRLENSLQEWKTYSKSEKSTPTVLNLYEKQEIHSNSEKFTRVDSKNGKFTPEKENLSQK